MLLYQRVRAPPGYMPRRHIICTKWYIYISFFMSTSFNSRWGGLAFQILSDLYWGRAPRHGQISWRSSPKETRMRTKTHMRTNRGERWALTMLVHCCLPICVMSICPNAYKHFVQVPRNIIRPIFAYKYPPHTKHRGIWEIKYANIVWHWFVQILCFCLGGGRMHAQRETKQEHKPSQRFTLHLYHLYHIASSKSL